MTIRRMRIACCVTKATDTHTIHIYICIYLINYFITYLLTYLFIYLLRGAESFLRS